MKIATFKMESFPIKVKSSSLFDCWVGFTLIDGQSFGCDLLPNCCRCYSRSVTGDSLRQKVSSIHLSIQNKQLSSTNYEKSPQIPLNCQAENSSTYFQI